ncbi:rod-determining factor RdfA [Halomicrobium katesii]|uniref:rod-determining factor RdfA n=1 Tax=Halomicrobium katesii TaxID=437163 RepID=UPI00036952C4|nr:rod-determining factor RdfA [Halomicrobium katesii]
MNRQRRSKVERLLDEYGLGSLGDELVASWTADGDDRKSLRQLATEFNVALVDARLESEGVTHFDSDGKAIYEALANDDAETDRATIETRLEREGVDVEQLQSDFVTYQAIRSYVKDVRDAEYETPSDEEHIEKQKTTIQRLVSRATSVTEEKLTRLRDTGRISLGDFRLIIDFQVYCRDCETQKTVASLLDEGGCECESEES